MSCAHAETETLVLKQLEDNFGSFQSVTCFFFVYKVKVNVEDERFRFFFPAVKRQRCFSGVAETFSRLKRAEINFRKRLRGELFTFEKVCRRVSDGLCVVYQAAILKGSLRCTRKHTEVCDSGRITVGLFHLTDIAKR